MTFAVSTLGNVHLFLIVERGSTSYIHDESQFKLFTLQMHNFTCVSVHFDVERAPASAMAAATTGRPRTKNAVADASRKPSTVLRCRLGGRRLGAAGCSGRAVRQWVAAPSMVEHCFADATLRSCRQLYVNPSDSVGAEQN